jgi:hypothetical protein
MLPLAAHVPAAVSVAAVAVVSVALIAYEMLRHREGRATIRAHRASLTAQDLARLQRYDG